MSFMFPPGSPGGFPPGGFPPGSSGFPPGSSIQGGFPPPPGPPPFRAPSSPGQRGRGGPGRVFPWSFQACLFRFTFIWLINGRVFWFYPMRIGRNSVLGYRWRNNRWEFYELITNRVAFFTC